MNKFSIYLIALQMAAICSCSGPKDKNQAETSNAGNTPAAAKAGSVTNEPEREWRDTLEWNGSRTVISVKRLPSPDGSTVSDENGMKYGNNTMKLHIVRNGSTVVQQTIEKSYFRSYIDADIYDRYVLEGLVFDKVDDGVLVFAASVGNPTQDDEFIPFKIKVDTSGNMSLKKSDDAITGSDEEEFDEN